jgi:hypothetical protein
MQLPGEGDPMMDGIFPAGFADAGMEGDPAVGTVDWQSIELFDQVVCRARVRPEGETLVKKEVAFHLVTDEAVRFRVGKPVSQ